MTHNDLGPPVSGQACMCGTGVPCPFHTKPSASTDDCGHPNHGETDHTCQPFQPAFEVRTRPWSVEVERTVLTTTLQRASVTRGTDIVSAMWGASRALIELRDMLEAPDGNKCDGCNSRPGANYFEHRCCANDGAWRGDPPCECPEPLCRERQRR